MENVDEKQLIAMAVAQKIIENQKNGAKLDLRRWSGKFVLNDVMNIAMDLSFNLYSKGVADYVFINDATKIINAANELGLGVREDDHYGYEFSMDPNHEIMFYWIQQERMNEDSLSGGEQIVEALSIVSYMLGIKDLTEYQEDQEGFDPSDYNFTTSDRVNAFRSSYKSAVFKYLDKGRDCSKYVPQQ